MLFFIVSLLILLLIDVCVFRAHEAVGAEKHEKRENEDELPTTATQERRIF